MLITEEMLRKHGATEIFYQPGDFIFEENTTPNYYYQITQGEIKLNNYDDEGKEFIQNILSTGDSLAESMLFLDRKYPVNAEALSTCTVLKLSKENFFRLIEEVPGMYRHVCSKISDNMYSKCILMRKISCRSASERLQEILQMLKDEQGHQTPFSFTVPFTRQQLASLTGLCVETTIRTIKKMERQKILRIKDRKILY